MLWRMDRRVVGLMCAFCIGVSTLGAQAAPAAPQGLAARALADSNFNWVRDSVPGFRTYFLRGTYAFTHRDSLQRRLPPALAHARALLGAPLPGSQLPPIPIDVFFVESREQMRALTGSAVTGFAHSAAHAVFLVTNVEWRAFERHEVMHVVAAATWSPIGPRNAWLQEGLAQAADGSCAGYPNVDVAVALAARHGWIDLATLLGKFREQTDLRAYLQAAAFVDHLLRTVGHTGVRELWLAEVTPATRIAGRALSEWEVEWRTSLEMSPRVPSERLNAIESVGCGIR